MSDKAKWGGLAMGFDGEGHITIARTDRPRIRKNRNNALDTAVRYSIAMGITNTDVRLMHWLQKNFGGQYYTSPSKNPLWKTKHRWQVIGRKEQERILLGILPYLVLKREQAIIALDFIRMNSEINPAKRQDLYEKTKVLNKRGKLVETNTTDAASTAMIESELNGNIQSAPDVNQGSEISCKVCPPPYHLWCTRKDHISDLA